MRAGPWLKKECVEMRLQTLLGEHIHVRGDGASLVRREYMTAIPASGPVTGEFGAAEQLPKRISSLSCG